MVTLLILTSTILMLLVVKADGQHCRFGHMGGDCRYDCNCDGYCNPQAGCTGNCTRGWDGPTCQRRNVALNRATNQSSDWDNGRSYTSDFAVDGRLGHNLVNTPCTHTEPRLPAWWTVTLDRTYTIYRFQIYNRIGNCGGPCGHRLNGFTLSVGMNNQNYDTCYTDTTTSDYGPGDVINGRCNDSNPRTGNTVRIRLPEGPSAPLALCEVRLFVCSVGWYGEFCDKECETTTSCSKCDNHGLFCEKCIDGQWGTDCGKVCGNCWNNTACDKSSSECLNPSPRCESGFEGDNCTTNCSSHRWGPDCRENCGQCHGGADCDRVNGDCPPGDPRCATGHTGSRCELCSSHSWGPDCAETCGQCHGGAVCDRVSGECPPVDPRCATGYTGRRCEPCASGQWGDNCVNTCSEKCINPACNITTGVCEEGCLPGYTGEYCDTVCQPGSWGDNCARTCSEYCLEQPCNAETGTCEGGCQLGHAGKFCDTEIQPVNYTVVIIGCMVGVVLAVALVTLSVIIWVKRRQPSQSQGAAGPAVGTSVTQAVPHPAGSSHPQRSSTDPVTYYNMTADEEHPYETVPEKEYDKMRFSRLDMDADTNYTRLT